MSFTATVENGAIKLPPDVHLPEGTKVTVVPAEEPGAAQDGPSLYETLKPLIGCIDTSSGDLADQHDHYLYGTPKRSR